MRPRASLPSPSVRALNTTPKTYLQQQNRKHRAEVRAEEPPLSPLTMDLFCRIFLSQFTVLDEDAFRDLVSLFQDLLVVDVGHGRDEALEQQQDVAHAQRPQLVHHLVPPGLSRQGRRPRLTGTATRASASITTSASTLFSVFN